MQSAIRNNLSRQRAALGVLTELLTEEFSHLKSSDPRAVSATEMSVQDLIRQLATEREDLARMVRSASEGAEQLAEILPSFPEEDRVAVEADLAAIDELEQECSRRSARNFEIALGLMDQARSLLEYMHNSVVPASKDVYAANGRYSRHKSEAAILRGRF